MNARAPETAGRVAPAWSLGVLTGGRSTRLGRDKASAPFLGATLLEHVLGRFAPRGVPAIVASSPQSPPPPPGVRRVDDPKPGLGPLAGLSSLLDAAETKFVLAIPCDAPLLPPDVGDRMLRFAVGVDAVLFQTDGRVQPFPALLSVELAPVLRDLVERGARRADAWHEVVAAAYVPFEAMYPDDDAARAFQNANDAETLARAEALCRAESAEE